MEVIGLAKGHSRVPDFGLRWRSGLGLQLGNLLIFRIGGRLWLWPTRRTIEELRHLQPHLLDPLMNLGWLDLHFSGQIADGHFVPKMTAHDLRLLLRTDRKSVV